MHLVCPKCATSYQVDAVTLGANGRPVRCTRCKNVWFAATSESTPADAAHEESAFRKELGADALALSAQWPPAITDSTPENAGAAAAGPPVATIVSKQSSPDQTLGEIAPGAGQGEPPTPIDPAAEPPKAGIPPALSDITLPTVDAPPLALQAGDAAASNASTIPSEPEDIESVAARRNPTSTVMHRRRFAPAKSRLPLVILVLVAVCTAIIGWRKDIVRHTPQMASLYGAIGLPVNVRGLVFTNVRIANETHDGVPVLTVEGNIVNAVPDAVEVPRLRFALRDAAGLEVYSWTAVPTQTVLGPGETLPFRSRLASPPSDVHDAQVRFFNRRDAAAGVH